MSQLPQALRNIKFGLRKAYHWFNNLSGRERLLVSITTACILGYSAVVPVRLLQEHIADTEILTRVRTRHYQDLSRLLKKYKLQNERLERLQATFNESDLTFQQVTEELDKIVRDSIGNSNYDLKKTGSAKELSEEFEKQDFALDIRSLSLEQLVKLLHKLEREDTPLFLGKVDIFKGPKDNMVRATLEIASIRKKKA